MSLPRPPSAGFPPFRATPSPAAPGRGWVLAVAAAVFLLCAPLWLNPGWFSHDELQWGARAAVARWQDLPWVAWTGTDQLQWRPLTFNLWLAISHALFESPRLMHALWVALGAGLAAWLAMLLARLGARPRVAFAAGLLFALSPYATYVHGWVATLAELLWVAAALALAQCVVARITAAEGRPASGRGAPAGIGGLRVVAAGVVFTTLGLLAKEAALAMPALLALCVLLWPRETALRPALVGSALAAGAYLALRLPVLMSPPAGSGYALAPGAVPGHLVDYLLFLPRVSSLEVVGVARAGTGFVVAAALLFILVGVSLLRTRPRAALAALAGFALALAPALPLATTAPQYAYGASLWLVAVLALAWPALRGPGRVALLLLALGSTWHGVNVMRAMHAIGERQAVFQPALAEVLARHEGVLRLHAGERWGFAYRRLSHEVPAWRGLPIGDRIAWVDDPARADYAVADDGRLVRASDR